jgi:hypothetical protein
MSARPDQSDYEPKFFLWHSYGPTLRATFSSANDALIWQQGNARLPYSELFYFTNVAGERIAFKDQARSPGHAHAILDVLDRGS